jgi:WD40 repeat protein
MGVRLFTAVAIATAAVLVVSARSTPTAEGGKEPARVDRYGDSLPKGAVMRLGTLRFCQPFPTSLAWLPDGSRLASGGHDHRIRVWDPDTGKERSTLEGHTSYVNCISISADGKLLASGAQDSELRLWDVDSGNVRRQFRGHKAPIECLALSPDGKLLASCCLAGEFRLWDTDTGKEIRSIPIEKGYRVSAMTFSPDSKRLAYNNRPDQGIQLVDVSDGNRIRAFTGHTDNVYDLIFTADGATLFSCSGDHTIRVWDTASGKELRRHGDEKASVRCMAPAPDGKTLTYGTHPDGLVHIWDIGANKHLVPPWKAHPYCIVSIAYSPDSKKVALGRDTIAIHDIATGKRLNPPPENDSRIITLQYSPDGKLLALWRQDHSIEVWDTAKSEKTMATRADEGRFTSMAFSPVGNRLTTARVDFPGGFGQGVVCHWDPWTGKLQKEHRQDKGWFEAMSYSANGETVACQNPGGTGSILLWSPLTATEQRRITVKNMALGHPQLSPDGRLVGAVSNKGSLMLWDTATGNLVREFGPKFLGGSMALTFSPDGKSIAKPSGRSDPKRTIEPDIVLWETATGGERLRIAIGEGQIGLVAFSLNGRLLASSGETDLIHVWDAWTGKHVRQFRGHRGALSSLCFAPDGKTLASGGLDGTVLIWDISGLPSVGKPPGKVSDKQLAKYWEDLASADAAQAFQAIVDLAHCPGEAEAMLKERLTATVDKKVSASLRSVRAIEVLERLATAEARAILGRFARETTDAEASREAKAALERLAKAVSNSR